MRKRRIPKGLINKKVIFITIILSMSLVGVGYANWNDNTKIELSLDTGLIDPMFPSKDEILEFNDGVLYLTPSVDGYTLKVHGKIFPSFNRDITINITDQGTIPSTFKNLEESNNEISDLSTIQTKSMRNSYNYKNEYIETFKLNVRPSIDNKSDMGQNSIEAIHFSDEISRLEQEIRNLEKKIDLYNQEKNYRFQYVLNFEQGI